MQALISAALDLPPLRHELRQEEQRARVAPLENPSEALRVPIENVTTQSREQSTAEAESALLSAEGRCAVAQLKYSFVLGGRIRHTKLRQQVPCCRRRLEWPMQPRVCPGRCKRDRHCDMALPVHARLPYVLEQYVLRRTCLALQSICSSRNTAWFVLQQRAGNTARSACLWDFSPQKPQGCSARAETPGKGLLPSLYQQCSQSICRAQHAKYSV